MSRKNKRGAYGLTPRLAMVAAEAERALRAGEAARDAVFDIGTDHAYLPAALLRHGVCDAAVATDVLPGPLAKARANLRARGLEARVPLRLGDGFAALEPGELRGRVAVIAGVGALTLAAMLRAGRAAALEAALLLLQPMNNPELLRAELPRLGFSIARERLAREDRRVYVCLACRPAPPGSPAEPYTRTELYLGKRPLEAAGGDRELCAAHLRYVRRKVADRHAGLLSASPPQCADELPALRRVLADIDALLCHCNV